MKIAMWSGPRNLSTAMMYAFGNRADFSAWDEPFYPAYLRATGIDHPMREEILSRHQQDAEMIAELIAGPIPNGKAHWYMKHMPFHMVDGFPLDWAGSCVNVHLIRHPARVVASYTAKRQKPTFSDIGFADQVRIFEQFPGPILDSEDIRADPGVMMKKLCDLIGLEYLDGMLSWPAGAKKFDGAWAPHWYGAVHGSTGFAGAEGPMPDVTGEAAELVERALPFYRKLHELRLR